jgi:hypothetical protein
MTLYDWGSKAVRSVRPGGYMRVKHPFVRLLLSIFFTLICGCLACGQILELATITSSCCPRLS